MSIDIDYEELAERALEGEAPDRGLAARLLDGENVELLRLLDAAYQPRLRHFGRKVMVHVLNNVQNGLCPEDCGYCAQNRNSGAAVRCNLDRPNRLTTCDEIELTVKARVEVDGLSVGPNRQIPFTLQVIGDRHVRLETRVIRSDSGSPLIQSQRLIVAMLFCRQASA